MRYFDGIIWSDRTVPRQSRQTAPAAAPGGPGTDVFGRPSGPGEPTDTGVPQYWMIAVLVLVAALWLYRVVYRGLKRGKKWARRLGIVCAVVSILGTGLGLFQPLIYGGWEVLHILIRISGIVVDALWLITVFRKPLPHWFALPF